MEIFPAIQATFTEIRIEGSTNGDCVFVTEKGAIGFDWVTIG